jgi:sugar phosphate isomerase/epimerase
MMQRRKFIQLAAGAGVAVGPLGAVTAKQSRLALGYDNYAVNAMGWDAAELIEYAVKLEVDTLFITNLGPLGDLEDGTLADVKKRAADAGIALYLGSWSICPSSKSFKNDWGTAEEHLRLGLRVAKSLGSPVFRVVLGAGKDRLTEGGIAARIADTVKVLKACEAEIKDSGVKVAMENHAGDMHSLELKKLVEAAGPEFVGVNFDSGNALWTMEDPLQALENVGKYVLTTSLRDGALWESENGVTVQWTAMGEGDLDWKPFFKRFAELCPEAPVQIETISGFNRELKLKSEDFWKAWPDGKPAGYEKFLALAEKGKERKAWKAPEGEDRGEAKRVYQRGEIERSIAYCRKELGLGRK